VRVLTCHGAKGLEAPIVFLADVTFVPDMKDRLLWLEPEGLPLWRVSRALQDPLSERAQQQVRQRELQEQRRLLYVAMTRAQDHLVVTGWKRNGGRGETTWYDMIDAAKGELQGVEPLHVPRLEGTGWRYANHQSSERAQRTLALAGRAPSGAPPSWLDRPAPEEPAVGPVLSPSRLFEDDDLPVRSPARQPEAGRFLRGRLIHRLLQSLPERAEHDREAAMARYLAQPAFGLAPEEQAEIAASVGTILALPELSLLFGQNARAEVPLVGAVGGQAIAGQIDRLLVTDEKVVLVDYKTNRDPPADAADVPALYLRQMAAYAALLGEIYPGRAIRCALLWTEGPRLMWLDEAPLTQYSPARRPA
jgi:ATP-dependent helicase/nuclease subunit A